MRVDVGIFEVDAADGVNETFAVDARAIGPCQHVSRKSDGLAVFSLSRWVNDGVPILGRKGESSPMAVLGGCENRPNLLFEAASSVSSSMDWRSEDINFIYYSWICLKLRN